MLVIRDKQMETFKETARQAFEEEMTAHLAEFSPPLFKAVGEKQMRKTVQLGISQAARYGFTYRGPVRLYLELMLLLGSYFDTDPQYPWAMEILRNQDADTQMQRADMLFARIRDYRNKVNGPEDAYTLKALRKISVFARHPLQSPLSSENFVAVMLQEIEHIYPQKAAYVGKEGLETLINKGIGGARRQQFSTARGMTLVTVLMLAFGHGCGADPLYPWIARTLKDTTITDAEARTKRLEKKALTWLDHVLAHFDKETPA